MDEEIIYSINIKDIQNVSREILNRELSSDELDLVKESVPKWINWFDAIENAISENLDEN